MMGKSDLRPAEFPRLEHYEPSGFMLPTSHYDAKKADRAVAFIENLRHTKGKWAGKRFWLLPWQEQIIRDVFGIVKENGKRQFLTAYVEIPKKNGKSELAAAVALYLLYGDNEPSAEVYGCAADRQQASIVYDVAKQMIAQSPALEKRSKVIDSVKRVVNYSNAGFYQVLSAEVGTKHGLNVSGLVFDELHAQPNRKLWDVMTKGSGDAREQPLFFAITTAGNDRNSVCWEQHQLAMDILKGRKADPTYYPVVYGLSDEEDWNEEENWYKANPSLGYTIQIDRVRNLYRQALDNPADENNFKQLRLNMWVSSIGAGFRSTSGTGAASPLTRRLWRAERATPDWTCPPPRTSPHLCWCFRRRARTHPTSCCPTSGCRRRRWICVSGVITSCTMCGKSRAISAPPRATWYTTALLSSSLTIWGGNFTSRRSPLTAGVQCRWHRT